MRHAKSLNERGFSLMEALMAVTVGLAFLGAVISLLTFTTKNWKEQSLKTEIRFDIQGVMEKIKRDARLADGGKILFYPSAASTYTAISIPGVTADDNGLLTMDEGFIAWDHTIIYHVHDNQLLRTVLGSFNDDADERQAELDVVAATGTSDDGETEVLFAADTATLAITPEAATFDGYAESVELSENTSFGTARLEAGTHTIQFKVSGKNDDSSGYRLGIDRISLSPSGSPQEAEVLTISSTSGDATVEEDMSAFDEEGLWSGNHQLEFQAGAVDDQVTFDTYYDQWLESNFESATHSETEVTGTDPVLSLSVRETQSLSAGWRANTQTGVTGVDYSTEMSDTVVRNAVDGAYISRSGELIRLKFVASSTNGLNITEAYFGPATAGTCNFSEAPIQLYFDNDPMDEGSTDPDGAVGEGLATTVDIGAGQYVWTNWFEPTDAISAPSATDFLVSYKTSGVAASSYPIYWDAGSGTHSYALVSGSPTADWVPADLYTTSSAVFSVEQMAVWSSTGVATSQVYDTTLNAPSYAEMTWTTNGIGTYLVKARSSGSPTMTGATDWSVIAGSAMSPVALNIGNGRYVQFQVTFSGVSPYAQYPELDDLKITWPGQTSLVEISGYFTRRPNYGTFEVIVDGESITKALAVQVEAEKDFRGRTHVYESSAVIDCKNTGL